MMQKIGNKLRLLRNLHGYSQEVIANELNITQKTYSRLENDEMQLTTERTTRLAQFYEIDELEFHRFLEIDEKEIIRKIIKNNQIASISGNPVVQNQDFTEKEREILFEQIKCLNTIIQELREENKRLKEIYN
ncbi:MAG: XRE family transcriptional regulator [Cytophagales bacterium]|nr:MAG: XRE family transcriptional regulator [Cytophagales bacterium]